MHGLALTDHGPLEVRLRMEGQIWEELQPQLLPRPRRRLFVQNVKLLVKNFHEFWVVSVEST